jgi:hypothetical protein
MAVAESLTQMTLANSAIFIQRLTYLMGKQAIIIKAEPNATVGHALREAYADSVVANALFVARAAASIIVADPTLLGTVVLPIPADPNLIDSSVTDAVLQTAIANAWNTLSKV